VSQEDAFSGGPAFALSQLENATIMTLLTESLDSGNSSWLREKILNYTQEYQPPLLVLNLVNIWHIDRLGVGFLINLKSRLPKTTQLTLMAVQEPVETQLQAMYLRHTFKVFWPVQSSCPICGQVNCAHTAQWQHGLNEYYWQSDKQADHQAYELTQSINQWPSEPDWFQIYAQDPRYQALEAERKEKEFWQKIRNFILVGCFSSVFVWGAFSLVLIAINNDWSKGFEASKSSLKRSKAKEKRLAKPRVLSPEEIVDHYDRDGDGIFTRQDWDLLNSNERLVLINHGFQDKKVNNRSLFEQFKR
jgi:anti-anti-sigma regulatory factor